MVRIGNRELAERQRKYLTTSKEPDEYEGVDLTTLKPKMKRFARHYMQTMNIAESCRSVGYNESSGYRVLKRPDVKAYLQWLVSENADAAIMSPTQVLEELTNIALRNSSDYTVTVKGDVVEKPIDTSVQLSALNSLAKFHELMAPDVRVEQSLNIVVDITDDVPKEAEEVEEQEDYIDGDFTEIEEEDNDVSYDFLSGY